MAIILFECADLKEPIRMWIRFECMDFDFRRQLSESERENYVGISFATAVAATTIVVIITVVQEDAVVTTRKMSFCTRRVYK